MNKADRKIKTAACPETGQFLLRAVEIFIEAPQNPQRGPQRQGLHKPVELGDLIIGHPGKLIQKAAEKCNQPVSGQSPGKTVHRVRHHRIDDDIYGHKPGHMASCQTQFQITDQIIQEPKSAAPCRKYEFPEALFSVAGPQIQIIGAQASDLHSSVDKKSEGQQQPCRDHLIFPPILPYPGTSFLHQVPSSRFLHFIGNSRPFSSFKRSAPPASGKAHGKQADGAPGS